MTGDSTEAKQLLHARCVKCEVGWYVIYDSRAIEKLGIRIAYLECNRCKCKPSPNRVEFSLSDRPSKPKF